MQRRLTIALVGVALASVVLVGAGVLTLAQIGARDQAEQEAVARLDFLVDIVDESATGSGGRPGLRQNRSGRNQTLLIALPALGLSGANFASVDSDGLTVVTPLGDGDRRAPPRSIREGPSLSGEEHEALLDGEAVVLDIPGPDVVVMRSISVSAEQLAAMAAGTTPAIIARRPVVTVDRDARLWFLASAGLVLAGSLVASWLLARRFAGPIGEIESATTAIAEGDLSARVDIEGDDEFAQLGQSVNRMAEDLQRSKALDQQFLMSVSHDLRTPLTAIAGYAEALSDGAANDPAQTGEIISNHAGRLERLVGDLLDLARLDANRFTLDLAPVDVTVAVGRTVAGMTPRAERHRLDLAFHSTSTSVTEADADRLAQAVANLIDNAIKFARSKVDVAVTDIDGSEVEISVVDDGPGIGVDDLPHVFDRLYVAKSQPRRAENSSGLGLAIVSELIAAMGGTVTAESSAGHGTRMVLRLPIQGRSPDG